jgi:threonylcarbamoyladenosine tRNA methylthiotransferase MtaB
MRRRYVRSPYRERIEKIRRLVPYACIGADVIVGFPGETREDFLETYRFLNELDISYLHVFTYSERPNTVASTLPGSVPPAERAERSRMLHILSDKKRRQFYECNLGREATVLFEKDIEEGFMHGFTENYIRVRAGYDPLMINETMRVRLHSISAAGAVEVEEAGAMHLH